MAPGFIDKVRQTALVLKQRLAEVKDRNASVIAEVRGEGLLIGLRMVPPASEMVDELRAEKMLAVARRRKCCAAAAAADHRRERNRRGGARASTAPAPGWHAHIREPRQAGGGVMTGNGVRHFLDLIECPKPRLRGIIDASRVMKAERAAQPPPGRRWPAGRWR